MKELYQKFKEYLEVNKKSKVYLSYIKDFLSFVETNNLKLEELTTENVNKFLLTKNKLSASGTNNYIKAITDFYKCLEVEPLFKIKLLKTENKLPIYITKEELDELIKYGMTYLNGLIEPNKLRTLLYFLFCTGVRKAELLKLRREDINLKDRQVKIKLPTKGKSERIIPFPKKLVTMLENYFNTEQEDKNAFNLTSAKFGHIIKRLNEFTTKHITPHIFRHSFAMHLVFSGVDIAIAKKLLGHSDLKTTEIYYRPDLKTTQKIYNEKFKI